MVESLINTIGFCYIATTTAPISLEELKDYFVGETNNKFMEGKLECLDLLKNGIKIIPKAALTLISLIYVYENLYKLIDQFFR